MRELKEALRLASRYLLIRRLGVGGMSEVWLARDERAGTTVALKFLKSFLADNASYRELFHKEWLIGSRLMHANIGRVFEYHDESEGPFYSLQYINGPDLGVLANEGLQDAIAPFGLLADALRYGHGKGIVHRDIKAANVLLDDRGVPHLIDFGVAIPLDSADQTTGGSKIAASPGQRNGDPAEAADDIYALGVLLHETLTGAPPADAILDASLRRADGQEIGVPLQQLVRDMLSVDATHRPSAEQVLERLQAAGYPPGPSRILIRSGTSSPSDTGEAAIAIKSIRPASRHTVDKIPTEISSVESNGLPPTVVLTALGVLLLIVLGVIFILPNALDTNNRVSGESGSEPDEFSDTGNVGEPVVDSTTELGVDGDRAEFGENLGETSTDEAVRIKKSTDDALGDLLSQLERLKFRGIERWGGQPYLDVMDVYAAGDQAYLNKTYQTARDRYLEATKMLEPFFDQITREFEKSMAAAKEAFDAGDFIEAVRLYDLAVTITPGDPVAERGLERATNLEAILNLMSQGAQFEDDLELQAARLAYEKALELDAAWDGATVALSRIQEKIRQQSFNSRMSEGLEAVAIADYATARAAFNAAKAINPNSREPVDGLLQVDQEIRLARIRAMEDEAGNQEINEEWESAVTTYQALLDVDSDLQFAKEGLALATSRANLHRRLNDFISDPDSLNDSVTLQRATKMVLDVSRMESVGPRLNDQKKELSILLKRAATPLPVRMISDNATEVSVYKVGKLGRFVAQELSLRPGVYVVVGSRSGFRDVRLEFRVAPDIELQPIVVQCEEAI